MSKKEEDRLPFSISKTKDKLKQLRKFGWKGYVLVIALFVLLGGLVAYYQKGYDPYSKDDFSSPKESLEQKEKEKLSVNSITQSQTEDEKIEQISPEIGQAVTKVQEQNKDKKEEQNKDKKEVTSLPQMSSETVSSQFHNLIMPLKGEIVSHCEWYKDKMLDAWKYNPGLNIRGEIGVPIKAVESGRVKSIIRDDYQGITVIIKHNEVYNSLYSHLEKTNLKGGTEVNKGQVIGKLGDSGAGEDSNLHFEIIKDGQTVDPMDYLN